MHPELSSPCFPLLSSSSSQAVYNPLHACTHLIPLPHLITSHNKHQGTKYHMSKIQNNPQPKPNHPNPNQCIRITHPWKISTHQGLSVPFLSYPIHPIPSYPFHTIPSRSSHQPSNPPKDPRFFQRETEENN